MRANALGLSSCTHFMGTNDAIASVMASFDVAVQCSLSESFSNVLIEYMASAKPIVATRVGDAHRIIGHGTEGLLVEPGSPIAVAGAVASLLREPEAALEMGGRARTKAEHNWSIPQFSRNHRLLYTKLLGAARSCAR